MADLRAHYFQHVPFEGLGSIETWLAARGYSIGATRFFEPDHRLPELAAADLLVIMGGPMSVNDERQYPWLAAEKRFVRDFIGAGKPVLGICLGAQLIASALGAAVYPNGKPEIGWLPVHGTGASSSTGTPGIFAFPKEHLAFHWHGETFDLPTGATLLASSHGCKHQGFQLDKNVIGLQFHLETTPESASALVKHCGDELVAGDYIDSPGQILFAPESHYRHANALMEQILEHIA